jgi:hypothetical protein
MRTIFQMGVPVSGKNMFPSKSRGCRPGSPCAPTKMAGSLASATRTCSSR